MTDGEVSHYDLEAFQRWAIVVDDELGEAVNAMMALEEPDAEPILESDEILHSDRSSSDLANDLVKELDGWRESPRRPAWFTPAFQMVLVVSTRADLLMDYVHHVLQNPSEASDEQKTLLVEKIEPALSHYHRFLGAVIAAGYLK